MIVSVHGDDFTVGGRKKCIDWFEKTLGELYEYKCAGRLGPGTADGKELTILNRVVRWTGGGIEYEADPRQAEKLLEEFALDSNYNQVATPGIKPLPTQLQEDKPLSEAEHTRFRAISARANYLSADRPDLQYAAKEICRHMSNPTELSLLALKR